MEKSPQRPHAATAIEDAFVVFSFRLDFQINWNIQFSLLVGLRCGKVSERMSRPPSAYMCAHSDGHPSGGEVCSAARTLHKIRHLLGEEVDRDDVRT